MSHNQSACIPPPSSYAPRNRDGQHSRTHERTGRGGSSSRGQRHSHQSHSKAYNRGDRQREELEKLPRVQPKDRFHRNDDDEYFAHVQDEEEVQLCENSQVAGEDADGDDPLDAYMKSLEESNNSKNLDQGSSNSVYDSDKKAKACDAVSPEVDKRGVRLDIDSAEDLEESYYQYIKQSKRKQSEESDEYTDLVEYDTSGNPVGVRKVKKEIDPLPQVDHSIIFYDNFDKNFYQEHDDIRKLTHEQSEDLRSKLEIKVFGNQPPKPVCSFAHFNFDEQLMKVIRKSEYTQPTPIQAQAIPAILSGRNVIGIAMTGSGKTAAYLWPMIIHIKNQSELKRNEGPIGLVLVPTRELALQVYSEAKKFSQVYKIKVVCAYGGGSKYLQSEDLRAGAEIVVATPGRLIDLVKLGATNLRRVTYLVLDEADRFFDMGFEIQVRSICTNIRPDRQTLLFSATFKKKIEQLALTVTEDPIKIVQKSLGEANEDVTQHVILFKEAKDKWDWLTSKLVEFASSGSVLIFVTRIANCEELHNNLKQDGTETLLLHGDMEQSERNRVITTFRRQDRNIMIATDVAARGLDIAHIRTVINYDVARDIDTHTHRIGRTGRAGTKGDAYTLLTEKDRDFAGSLVKNLRSSSQIVTDELMKLAMKSHSFRKSQQSKIGSHKSHGHSRDSGHHNRTQEHHHRGYHSEEGSYSHERTRSYDNYTRHGTTHDRDQNRRHSSQRESNDTDQARMPSQNRHYHNYQYQSDCHKRSRWR